MVQNRTGADVVIHGVHVVCQNFIQQRNVPQGRGAEKRGRRVRLVLFCGFFRTDFWPQNVHPLLFFVVPAFHLFQKPVQPEVTRQTRQATRPEPLGIRPQVVVVHQSEGFRFH